MRAMSRIGLEGIMNKKQFRAEAAFQATLAIARQMVAQGLVTQREYRAFVKRLLEKYHPPTGDLFT